MGSLRPIAARFQEQPVNIIVAMVAVVVCVTFGLPSSACAQANLVGVDLSSSERPAHQVIDAVTSLQVSSLGAMPSSEGAGHVVGKFLSTEQSTLLMVQRTGSTAIRLAATTKAGQRLSKTLWLSTSLGRRFQILSGFDLERDGISDIAIVDTSRSKLRWFIITNPLETTAREYSTFVHGKRGAKVEWFYGASQRVRFVAMTHQTNTKTVKAQIFSTESQRVTSVKASYPSALGRLQPIRLEGASAGPIRIALHHADDSSIFLFDDRNRLKRFPMPQSWCNGVSFPSRVYATGRVVALEVCSDATYRISVRSPTSGGASDTTTAEGSLPIDMNMLRRGDLTEVVEDVEQDPVASQPGSAVLGAPLGIEIPRLTVPTPTPTNYPSTAPALGSTPIPTVAPTHTAAIRATPTPQIFSADYFWTKTFGHSGYGAMNYPDLRVGPDGSIYMFGSFQNSLNFGTPQRPIIRTSIGTSSSYDAFIVKLSRDGELVWLRSFGHGTDGRDAVRDIEFDSDGNLLVGGRFSWTVDFSKNGDGSFIRVAASGGYDESGFLMKMTPDNDTLWVKAIQVSHGYVADIALGPTGDIHAVGSFCGTGDLNPDSGIDRRTAQTCDVFVSKYTSNGDYLFSKVVGGPEHDWGQKIAVDRQGNFFVAGAFHGDSMSASSQIVITTEAPAFTNYGGADEFLLSYTSDGTYRWGQTWGSTDWEEYPGNLLIDADGAVYFSAAFGGTINLNQSPSGAADVRTSSGGRDLFVVKLSNSGEYIWGRAFGGAHVDSLGYGHDMGWMVVTAAAMNFDTNGAIIMSGSLYGMVDIDGTNGALAPIGSSNSWSTFYTKITPQGDFSWAKSTQGWLPTSIQAGQDGEVLLCGQFTGSNRDFNLVDPQYPDLKSSATATGVDLFVSRLRFESYTR